MKVGATDSLPLSYLPPFISLILVNVTTGSPAAKLDTPEPFSTLSSPPFRGPVIKCPPEGLVATFNAHPIGGGCCTFPLEKKEDIKLWQVIMDPEKGVLRSLDTFL